MLANAMTVDALATLATLALLIGLELVLGIDNILVISLVVDRLPEAERQRARMIGLLLAMVLRLVFVGGAFLLVQIVLLDMVFSVDSVITAVGLTQNLLIIGFAVIVSFGGLLLYAGPIGEFILRHPALKILALSFLVTIGVTLVLEGMGQHVEKGYIYLPMGFALLVEILQMRYLSNAKVPEGK
jgi:predicted tellurium resistance membrane protein TerC